MFCQKRAVILFFSNLNESFAHKYISAVQEPDSLHALSYITTQYTSIYRYIVMWSEITLKLRGSGKS